MRYKKFGKTGLEVSQICLGTWGIGGAGWDAHSDEERMDAIAAERNVPLAQIAVNWTLQQEFISSCIAGAQSRRKVEENCAGLNWNLTDEEIICLNKAIKCYRQ